MRVNEIMIKGFEQAFSEDDQPSEGILKKTGSYLIGQSTRGEITSKNVKLNDGDIIELVFEDGTTWFSSPYTLEDIFPESIPAPNRSGEILFEIPWEITMESTERGIFKKVLLKVLNIFTRKAIDFSIEQLATKLEDKQLDGKIGLFNLSPEFQLYDFKPSGGNKPYCLLIHGTASSISGSFGEARDTSVMKFLLETYADRILAFQHRTLTENPLKNARDLVKALPENCILHLITTSRGGLVGEVLSRFCNSSGGRSGFNDTELSILKKEYPKEYFETLLQLIGEINSILKNKNITVEKFIRIACPAGGTTLVSKRMDNFFNITLNLVGLGTGLAVNPVYIAFKNLIASVIDCKEKVGVLPGLEVQRPDSPFIKAINCVMDISSPFGSTVINNSLVVIAGNSKPAFKLSALLIIVSKLFFLKKNDLVVDTESMSLGTRRSGMVLQFFYEDSDINHFKYFENRTTNNAILVALKSEWGRKLPGFTDEQLSIPVAADRNALLKLDKGELKTDTVKVSGTRPIVLILPGIMGSNLSSDEGILWINYWKFITGGLMELKDKNVRATSVVSTSYKLLVEYLQGTYDIITFPFDWRLSLEEAADKLNDKILELMKFRQPVKIIGHSMGGVLVRDFMVLHRDTWAKLNKSNGFRLIFLGAPLNGSFRIPAVLSGMDGIIDKLSKIDLIHSKKELVELFSAFRGILGLLPSNDPNNDFARLKTWQDMLRGIDEPDWPLPSDDDLNWFAGYRDKMKTGIVDEDYANAVYIAGRDKATPCGYRIDKKGPVEELVFLSTAEGDQSVTWDSGIPPRMNEDKSVYYVDVIHGSLANEPEIFNGIKEILAAGATNLFSKNRPVVRGEEKLFKSPEYRDFDLSLAGIENTILGLGTKAKLQVSDHPIRISISQGDLFYAEYPLLAGHFENDGILYAEKAIDKYLDGKPGQRHQLGIYPGPIGSSEVFLTDQAGFKGAVIIGLGKPGELTASELTNSIEQGVANFLLRPDNYHSDTGKPGKEDGITGISSLLIGSGYAGLSIENSMKAVIQGVNNANIKVRNLKLENSRLIEHIEFIELYEDIAVNALFSLSRIEREQTNSLKIIKDGKGIKSLLGLRRRIPVYASEGWWNRITVTKDKDDDQIPCLYFTTSTKSSREEKQPLYTNLALIEGMIKEISTSDQWSPERAKTIFELLIPNDFKDQLKKHGNINWILDYDTASFPWELLQDSLTDTKPICVSAGMIRLLATSVYRREIKTVPKNNALIVADPDLEGFINQLPGALKEGQMVSELFSGRGIEITTSFKGNHSEIMEKLFRDDYKIIHLAGHGTFNEDKSKGSGMVIGKNLYLSSREIQQMSTVPELVFINCCFLGKTSGVAEEFYEQRYKLAANLGTQLIKNGVRCVIAAGWAVNDDAALEFASVFYKCMFDGYNFGESTMEARKAVYEKYSQTNTWGAYQCYGDPFYKFEQLTSQQKSDEKSYLISQEAEIDLYNLLSEIEVGILPTPEYLKKLDLISKAVDKSGIRNAMILEYEANVYFDLGEYEHACEKFNELLTMDNTSFSFSVVEKYFNARAKKIIIDFRNNKKNKSGYLEEMDGVITDLQILLKLSPTSERWNILGSSFKRLGFLSNKPDKMDAYRLAADAYQKSYTHVKKWYSLTNWLVFGSILNWSKVPEVNAENKEKDENKAPAGNIFPTTDEALMMLESTETELSVPTDQMAYWNMIAGLNIRLCKYILQFSKIETRKDLDTIRNEISTLWKMAGSKGKRFAEIEHLVFIIDVLDVVKNNQAKLLRENLIQFKDELERLI